MNRYQNVESAGTVTVIGNVPSSRESTLSEGHYAILAKKPKAKVPTSVAIPKHPRSGRQGLYLLQTKKVSGNGYSSGLELSSAQDKGSESFLWSVYQSWNHEEETR